MGEVFEERNTNIQANPYELWEQNMRQLFKVHHTHIRNHHNKTLHTINICQLKMSQNNK